MKKVYMWAGTAVNLPHLLRFVSPRPLLPCHAMHEHPCKLQHASPMAPSHTRMHAYGSEGRRLTVPACRTWSCHVGTTRHARPCMPLLATSKNIPRGLAVRALLLAGCRAARETRQEHARLPGGRAARHRPAGGSWPPPKASCARVRPLALIRAHCVAAPLLPNLPIHRTTARRPAGSDLNHLKVFFLTIRSRKHTRTRKIFLLIFTMHIASKHLYEQGREATLFAVRSTRSQLRASRSPSPPSLRH
jgi:hypothetical protein